MLYDYKLKETVLDVLQNRMSSIVDSIRVLVEEGYEPNKNKKIMLDWVGILIHAYENVDLFSREQQDKLDNIYNKIIKS